jgi:hypothetical protein
MFQASSSLVLSTDIAAARPKLDRDAAINRDDKGRNTPTVERNLSAEQWPDEIRRHREEAKARSPDRERTRDRTKYKDREGPDYEQ